MAGLEIELRLKFLWRALKARYRDQRAEISSLTAALSPGDIAIDVGANKGSYLFWLSKAAAGGEVIAFEPQPKLAEYLRSVCKTIGLDNVTVVSSGVSDANGNLTLHVPGKADSPSASFEKIIATIEPCRTIEVPVVTLDDFFADRTKRVAAIKIDVEGHELAALRGARNIIMEDSPCLVIESESRHMAQGTVLDVLDYVVSFGYTGYFVQRGIIRPLEEFDPKTHQAPIGERFWNSKDYCNNFIFRK